MSDQTVSSYESQHEANTLLPEAFVKSKVKCCMCVDMRWAINMIGIYEFYHIYTQYQVYFFLVKLRDNLSTPIVFMFFLLYTVNMALMISCFYNFFSFWVNPLAIKNRDGIVQGL